MLTIALVIVVIVIAIGTSTTTITIYHVVPELIPSFSVSLDQLLQMRVSKHEAHPVVGIGATVNVSGKPQGYAERRLKCRAFSFWLGRLGPCVQGSS